MCRRWLQPAITIDSTAGGISRTDAPARAEKSVARVTAIATSPLTVREVRVLTRGISNPLQINVGHLPEIREAGSNNAIDQAQEIKFRQRFRE